MENISAVDLNFTTGIGFTIKLSNYDLISKLINQAFFSVTESCMIRYAASK